MKYSTQVQKWEERRAQWAALSRDGWKPEDIAKEHGVSKRAVRKALVKARRDGIEVGMRKYTRKKPT